MIRGDKEKGDLGTTSFALLGVLLILLSIVAVSYVSYIENINYENKLQADKVSALEDAADKTLESIKTKLHLIAIESAFHGNREGILENPSNIFHNRVENYFDESAEDGGWKRGQYLVTLDRGACNISMGGKVVEIDSIIPKEEDRGGYERIATDIPGELGRDNHSFYYGVEGVLSVIVEDTDNGLTLNRTEKVDITVDVPYPFLKRNMDELGSSLHGSEGQVARITRYILTTIAQYRTLMGYGMKSFEHVDNSTLGATKDILTLNDVELALNFAILLEMAYQFRTYDPFSVKALVDNSTTQDFVELELILDTYIEKGRVCPGDIIALYYGFGYDGDILSREDAKELNLEAIIAQALYAILDQFILKYFDYFGFTDIVNFFIGTVETINNAIEKAADVGKSLWGWVTSSDDDEDDINPKQVKIVKDWVRETFAAAGMTGTYIVKDIYLPFNSINGDEIYGYPKLPDDFHESYEITIKTRLTSEENRIFTYSCDHEVDDTSEETCPEMIEIYVGEDEPVYIRCGADRVLLGYQYALHTINVTFSGGSPVQFQPVDILNGNDEIWQEFYDMHFTDVENPDISDIQGLVKSVIERFVDAVTDVDEVKEIINRYNKVEIDVYDRRSLFNDIQKAINGAIEETVCFFKKNPDTVKDVVMDAIYDKDGDPQVEDLKEILLTNYEDFYGEEYRNNMAGRTAIALIMGEGNFVSYDIVDTEIVQGGINDRCDASRHNLQDPSMEDLRHVLMYGGSESSGKFFPLAISLISDVETALDEIKEREVEEVNIENKHSHEDGLIVQALDSYIYNTTIVTDDSQCDTRTRGGNIPTGSAHIESITPNPATMGQDTVRFRSYVSCNYTHLEWTSNMDGHLSNRMNFNLSAAFMSAGDHTITLTVTDDDGFIHQDTEHIFINRPPVAVIDDILPSPATQGQIVTYRESSYDIDGHIVSYLWEFGDGHNSSDQEAVHVYSSPGYYTVTLTVTDDKGGTDSVFQDILVDNRPYIIGISPEEGQDWEIDQAITVVFSEEVDPSSLEYTISEYMDFSVSWHENNTIALFTPDEDYKRYTHYNLTISDVLDVDNGTQSSMEHPVSHQWQTIGYARVTGYHPSGDEEVKLKRSIVLTFSEAVELVDDIDNFISGDWGWEYIFENNNERMILDHDKFTPGTRIILEIDLSKLNTIADGSIVTTDGVGGTDLEISFLTEENLQPMLVSVSPANGTRNVSTSGHIDIRFNMPMNTTSFNITFYPEVLGLTYQWDHDNTSVKVGYEGLNPGMRYVVYIDACNEEGKALYVAPGSDDYTNPFTFYTKDETLPYVVAISPWNGQTRYLTNAPVVIIFSKSVCPYSLNFTIDSDPGGWREEWNWDFTELKLFHDDFKKDSWYTFSLLHIEDLNGNEMYGTVNVTFHTSMNGKDIQGSLLQRMVWSILDGGLMDDSLFGLAESMLKSTTSNLILSSQMSNLEVRLPLAVSEEYRYSSGTEESMNDLELFIEYSPGYIHLDEESSVITAPSGTHYTNIWSISSRPFETHWDVSIPKTMLQVNVSTDSDVILIEDEHYPVWVNDTLCLEFDIRITVSSGWGLSGVDYTMKNDFFSDIKTVLDHLWGFIKDSVSFIIDAIRKLIDVITNLVETIKEYAAKLLEYIGNMIQNVVEELIRPHVEGMLDLRDKWWFNDIEQDISILGLNLELLMEKDGSKTGLPMYDGLVRRYVDVSFGGELLGTSYRFNLNVLQNNVVAFGQIKTGGMTMDWQCDPLADPTGKGTSIYSAWFQAQGRAGKKGSGALLNFTVPEIPEPTQEFSLALSSIVPIDAVTIPIGPIVVTGIDLGAKMEIMNVEDGGGSLLSGMISKTFRETVSAMSSMSFSLDYIIQFIKTLIQRFVDEVISLILNFIRELSLFFKAVISGIEVSLTFGFQGGETIIAFFQWIAVTIRDMIENISNMRLSGPSRGLSSDILEGTWLGITIGDKTGSVQAFFGANLPALAALVGKDMGRWMMNFGVDIPELDMILIKGELVQW